ncbi:MAG: CoA-binding protein, partial [Firmicutes bacterium]|nr:CoA-binding protein [Bacillota bacterium]
QGRFHVRTMREYGTPVVAGVAPGHGGTVIEGVPVFNTVAAAVAATGATASVVLVPAAATLDAAFEAMAHGIRLLVLIPEHVPVQDAIAIREQARRLGVTVLGPNTFGVIRPALRLKLGIMPAEVYRPGPVAIAARSGTLSYEIADALTRAGLGQSIALGIGGDPVVGFGFTDALAAFARDPGTQAVVLVGEIGGTAEEEAARLLPDLGKPVVAYLAGRFAPPGRRMGHAGAIIERGQGTLASKEAALRAGGARVVDTPQAVVRALAGLIP